MIGVAMPASRSLIALLVGTVVFFALWMVALKPSSKSGSPAASHGLGTFQSDINKAHQAVATSNASNAASGNENATASSGGASSQKASSSATKASASASKHTAKATGAHTGKGAAKPTVVATASGQNTIAREVSAVRAAVTEHKVLALLFYNPAAADDQAVKQELASVPTHKGEVVKLAIPLNEAANFTNVTQQVPVNLSPTLVLVSRAGDANEDVGYTAPFVIDQQITDALASS